MTTPTLFPGLQDASAPFRPSDEIASPAQRRAPVETEESAKLLASVIGAGLRPAQAQSLLADTGGLRRAFRASYGLLSRHLDPEQVSRLESVRALVDLWSAESLIQRDLVSSTSAVTDYLKHQIGGEPVECVRVLHLDTKYRLIADEEVSRGTVDHAPLSVRDIIRRVLERHTFAFVIAHCHPSGCPQPSSADIKITRQMHDASKAIGVTLLDHIIVGADTHYSFAADGRLK